MSERTETPRLTERFDRALTFAMEKHGTQLRKGEGDIPYMGHLLSVTGLVIEAGGTENQVIAALLHDAAEDAGGEATLAEIRAKFGDEVAGIVGECSDTFDDPKPPWKQRKEVYIAHIEHASDGAVLVSLADKLDNARGMLRDHGLAGDALWERFRTKSAEDQFWYYGALLEAFKKRTDSWMVEELENVLTRLRAAAHA
ncbi:MAG: HD domain-containing protein [Mycobacteriaceae bacterium]